MPKYQATAYVEFEFEITASITPGSDEYIPPHDRPDLYDPGSAPTIEDVHVFLNGVDITTALSDEQMARVIKEIENDLEAEG